MRIKLDKEQFYELKFSSDIFLGIEYFVTENPLWGMITFLITFISGWMVAYHSLFESSRYKMEEKRSTPVIFCHIFLLGPLFHFWELLKDPFNTNKNLENDIFKMRFLEGTTEAAPQVIFHFVVFLLSNLSLFSKC